MPVGRCAWAKTPEMIAYHDREWGRGVHDDRTLFEFLVLEGAQAGLSWETILRKRERYRKLFAKFEPARVARFTPVRIERILRDPGIVRNRAKIEAAVENARAFLRVKREFGSFDDYLKSFKKPGKAMAEALSKDLRARGFRFVGPTICYAFMQAVGIVNDHELICGFRRGPTNVGARRRKAP
jgi:DNA-3-methyladenine glycosylase I